jgi:uncharacterized protein YcfJ
MKTLLATTLVLATASPALAETVTGTIQDHYKIVLEQTPYNVEVCRDVNVQSHSNKEFDADGAILGGIIGGVIGNQFGKGSGKEAMTGIGALTGAMIGGSKEGEKKYHTQRKCYTETRYKEKEREVYSHSTITFVKNGQKHVLNFSR